MAHLYTDFIFCKNNFFKNPTRVLEFANSLDFSFKNSAFPGVRTENLALSADPLCKEFAQFFARKLVNEVYTNIIDLDIDIRFHKYPDAYDDPELNNGWIHQDDNELLAGLVYFNEQLDNFDAGTSFYSATGDISYPGQLRLDFNEDSSKTNIEEYKNKLKNHNGQFKENIKIGNLYNRLITYDSKVYHKPNTFDTRDGKNRIILIFVVSNYSYKNREYDIYE